jgi:glutamine synthetase
MDSQKDYVLRTVEERGIRFVQLWFTDVLGIPKAFSITPAELENALDEGMTFDGSAIDGFSRVQESDVLAVPDPKTFQLLPYLSGEAPVARVVCDIYNLDGTAFEGDPRYVLRRALDLARDQGFSFYAAPELEYFYFAQPEAEDGLPPVPLDKGSYFELMGNNEATALRRETVMMLEEMGIPVEYSQHEDAPSQHEIDLRYTDAMTMADTVMLVRVVVKDTHVSLFDGDTNAFYDDSDEYHLSTVARQFISGVLVHASEITAITNQWVNSYKRLIISQEDQPLIEAPVYISWAQNNRSALVRVPPTKKGKRDSTRIEYRSPDPGTNPYLAWAVILAAGLAGIKGRYELPREASANIHQMSTQERLAEGIKPLPASLAEALDAMETSELVAETLGEHVFEWFLRNKRAEWAAYKAEVTPFELRRYLSSL